MQVKYLFPFLVLLLCSLLACGTTPGTGSSAFNDMFSIPREPATAFAPGQGRDLEVPSGKRVVVTDIYVVNLGGGRASLEILEQTGPNSFEKRYTFPTAEGRSTIMNLQTGVRLGDLNSIAGKIRIQNSSSSQASILARVNGIIVP